MIIYAISTVYFCRENAVSIRRCITAKQNTSLHTRISNPPLNIQHLLFYCIFHPNNQIKLYIESDLMFTLQQHAGLEPLLPKDIW